MRVLQALQRDELSMASREMFGCVAMAKALLRRFPDATHLAVFTDSSASILRRAGGSMPYPQLAVVMCPSGRRGYGWGCGCEIFCSFLWLVLPMNTFLDATHVLQVCPKLQCQCGSRRYLFTWH